MLMDAQSLAGLTLSDIRRFSEKSGKFVLISLALLRKVVGKINASIAVITGSVRNSPAQGAVSTTRVLSAVFYSFLANSYSFEFQSLWRIIPIRSYALGGK